MTDTTERKLAEKIADELFRHDDLSYTPCLEGRWRKDANGKLLDAADYIERELLAYSKQVREEQIDKDGDILQAQAYILNDYAQQDESSMAKLHVVNFLERRVRAQSSKEGKLP